MNKLRNMRCYLAGAMDRCKDGGIGWRNDITPILQSYNIVVLNPCKKPISLIAEDSDLRETINKSKREGDYDFVADTMRVIRHQDLRMVDVSDFMVLYIDIDTHMCGSYEELATAVRQKKPVLCVIEQGKAHSPNWLMGTVPHRHIFSNWDELISYLQGVDDGSDTDDMKRWVFFNLDE